MKKIWFCLMIMLLPMMAHGFGVVNNSGTTAADSISIPFFALDSAGNMHDLATGDSVYVHFYLPSGALAFRDSLAFNGAKITSQVNHGFTTYTWKEAVATIDGGTPKDGVYSYVLVVEDNTSSALFTPHKGFFQLYQTRDFDASLDFIDVATTSRLAPTVAARTLDIAATGEASPDFNNILGTLDAAEIGADAITAAKIANDAIGATEIANSAIDAATFVAGAIDAAAIATDAIGSAELAASAALEISDSTWDEILTGATHNVATSSGRRLRDISALSVITEGTAQSGTATSITLAAVTSFADGILAGNIISLNSGTGAGQTRHIETWTSSTDVATLHPGDDWTTTPDATSKYTVGPSAPADVTHIGDSALSEIWNFDTASVDVATGIGLALRDTLSAIIDTLQNQDNWILAKADSAEYMNTKSMGGVANTTSPGNLDEAFDDDGVGPDMDLNQLTIVATGANDNAVVITGQGTGDGMQIRSGSGATGDGIDVASSATNGVGMRIVGAGVGAGLDASSAGTGNGMQLSGGTGGTGLLAVGNGVGEGIAATGGVDGSGFEVTGGGTSGDALRLTASGSGNPISNDAITASVIADDAVDEISEKVWFNIDTLNVDSSKIGEWLVNNLAVAGALSAADIVAIADTIYHRDSSDANDGGATSMGVLFAKEVYMSGSASGLTKEDVADAVLDSMEIGTRQINYRSLTVDSGTTFASAATGSGFTITGGATSGDGINITATSGDGIDASGGTNGHGLKLAGAGTGEGLNSFGGINGSGAVFVGGSGGADGITATGGVGGAGMNLTAGATGDGLKLVGGFTSGDGLNITATSGDGMDISGGGTGDGIKVNSGSGATGAGIIVNALSTNGNALQLAGSGNGAGLRVSAGATGGGLIVTAAGGDAVQFTSSGGNGDGFQITGAGTGHGIIALSGSGVTGNAMHLQAASTNGHGLRVRGTGTGAGLSATGGLTGDAMSLVGGATSGDALALSVTSGSHIELAARQELASTIADTNWLSLLEARDGVAGSFGDSAQGWGASGGGGGLDTLRTTFVDSLLRRIADSIWLSLLEARDGVAGSFGDSAQGWGATSAGGLSAAEITDTLLGRVYDPDTTLGTVGALFNALATSQHIDSVQDSTTNSATEFKTSLGEATDDHFNGQTIVFLTGANANQSRLITDYDGATGYITVSSAFSAEPAAVAKFAILGQGMDIDLTSVAGADISFTYIAVDTSAAPDTAVQGVSVSAYNLSDQRIATGTTDGNGQIIFGFKLNDTIYFNASQPIGWTWEQRDTSFAVQNGGVDTTKGNKFNPTGPVAGKAATVSVFVFNNDRTAAENVAVSAYLSRSNVVDSAGFPVYNQTQTVYTDSDGLATFTCIWSSYMIPATKWYFSTSVPGTIKKKITIPRETTVTLDLR